MFFFLIKEDHHGGEESPTFFTFTTVPSGYTGKVNDVPVYDKNKI